MHRLCALILVAPSFLFSIAAAHGATELSARLAARNSVTASELQAHVAVLANDTFEGREAGSRGGRAAAGYIVERLRSYGLRGGGTDGGYTQALDGAQRNLLAILPGSDPQLRNEVILVGAHYDHVGYGNRSNSYGPTGYIHNGADDNASGIATILETAQALAANGALRRTVLFAFWDGEEKGLLGSTHWIRNPTVPKANLKCAINADMVGRLRNSKLDVYGSRTTYGMRKLLSQANASEGLSLEFLWQMTEDSDHFPFYFRNVPSLMFHTGKHADYHRPSDDVEKLNTAGMQSIARLMVDFILNLDDAEKSPIFRAQSRMEGRDESQRITFERPMKASPGRLGLRWRPQDSAAAGIAVSEVTRDAAAWRAQIRAGDRLTAWNGEPITSYDRFQRLVSTATEPATVTVVSPGKSEPRDVTVTLDGGPVRIGIVWIRDDAEPEAAIVKRVFPGSPAELAGLQAGDRIYDINGATFADDDGFEDLLHAARDKTPITVERQGKLRSAVLDVGEPLGGN
jgi:hypothetical protein